MELYPLKFKPVYKEKIWGGEKIKSYFNKNISGSSIGESWEISAHPHGISTVLDGPLAEKKLTDIFSNFKSEILGKLAEKNNYQKFPLLLKILDASKKLSVQVHPDNSFALQNEGEPGKTEMWYILDAEPEAQLVYGLKPETSRKKMKQAIQEGTLEKYLNRVPVKPGDCFFIPPGTIHALEEGILLVEIQQSSDTTYRVYDWNRKGQNGKPRELHIEKALQVTSYSAELNTKSNTEFIINTADYTGEFLAACPYFATEKIQIHNNYHIHPAGERFYTLMVLEGTGTLIYKNKKYTITKGDSLLLPAFLDRIQITGELTFLKSFIPDDKIQIINTLQKEGFTKQQIKELPGMRNWESF